MRRLRKIRHYIKRQFDIKEQAEDLGVSVWQAPSTLFIFLGVVVMVLMYIVFQVSQVSDDPIFLIVAEVFVVIITLLVGGFVIQAMEQIARANKMKSEFIAIASHQMKSPLAQIKWLLNSIEFSTLEEKNRYEQKFHLLQESNETMIQLINDLLDVARLDRGEKIVRSGQVDLVELANHIMEEYRIPAKKKHIDLKLQNLLGTQEQSVCTDSRRISVALDNLLRNALAYTREGGHVEVTLDSNRSGDKVHICVKDNGIGIPEAEQHQIFGRFFRASNGKRESTSGTGLGLFLTKGIVEQSGGKIWFRSIEGSGSMFCISLPLINKCPTYVKDE